MDRCHQMWIRQVWWLKATVAAMSKPNIGFVEGSAQKSKWPPCYVVRSQSSQGGPCPGVGAGAGPSFGQKSRGSSSFWSCAWAKSPLPRLAASQWKLGGAAKYINNNSCDWTKLPLRTVSEQPVSQRLGEAFATFWHVSRNTPKKPQWRPYMVVGTNPDQGRQDIAMPSRMAKVRHLSSPFNP